MTRIYVAGPMSGMADLNYPAFHAAAAMLRARGYEVENPAENPVPVCGSWRGYMRMAVTQLAQCDAVYLLPGWEASRGAKVEHALAIGLGLEVIEAGMLHQKGFHEEIADDLYREFGGFQILKANHHGVDIETVRGKSAGVM